MIGFARTYVGCSKFKIKCIRYLSVLILKKRFCPRMQRNNVEVASRVRGLLAGLALKGLHQPIPLNYAIRIGLCFLLFAHLQAKIPVWWINFHILKINPPRFII